MSYSCKHWFNSNGYQNLNYVWGGGDLEVKAVITFKI